MSVRASHSLTGSLLWGHVGRRTEYHRLCCQRLVVQDDRAGIEELGQAKIEDLETRLGQNDVPWFQVTMNDALVMSGGERAGDRDPVTNNPVHRQATRCQDSGERVALQVLHHDVVDAIRGSDVVQRTDIGMVQIRDGAGFAFETPSGFEIYRNFGQEDLDRHPSAEPNIFCPVNLAHAAYAEKRCPGDRRRVRSRSGDAWNSSISHQRRAGHVDRWADPNVNRSVAPRGPGFNERANGESGSEQKTKWVLCTPQRSVTTRSIFAAARTAAVAPTAVATPSPLMPGSQSLVRRRVHPRQGPRPAEMANLPRGSTELRQEHSTASRPGEMVKPDGAGQESFPRK